MIINILVSLFFCSLVGLGVILYRKIPELARLPEDSLNWQADFLPKIKKGMSRIPGLKNMDYELFLQKMLSKLRVITLKTENKTSNWLEKLRQRNNRKNSYKPDPYWDELKRTKNDGLPE